MKTNELALGDYVTLYGSTQMVDGLLPEQVRFRSMDKWVTLENVNPIPLTKEILLMNGFTCGITTFDCGVDGYLEISYTGDKDGLPIVHRTFGAHSEFRLLKIEYVHQLQQLLRLYKTNKEIKL